MISPRTILIAALAGGSAAGCAADTDERPATFEYLVTAVLKPSCGTATCHSSMTMVEGLAFDTVAAADATFASRPLAVPFAPEESELVFLLTTTGEKRMPLDSPLPDADLALIERWISDGAVR